jgi:pyruvate formate lyase activating enzyme
VAKKLPVCLDCIRAERSGIDRIIGDAHSYRQSLFGLPAAIPAAPTGVSCTVCNNRCYIPLNETGYCGLRSNERNCLRSKVTPGKALMDYYLDPHITNCCASYFCPGGTGIGYPKRAYLPGPEYGYVNLSVFFYGCSFDCLYCQNASHNRLDDATSVSISQFIRLVEKEPRISCVCYFGGSPEPQLPFAIRALEICQERFKDRILRQCFEMNGNANSKLLKRAAVLAAQTGGIIKFDLKAYSDSVNRALSGVSNQASLSNFAMLADLLPFDDSSYPPLMATTLLVPYYVDEAEVAAIARFLKDLNRPTLEYSLLVFFPKHLMTDLPVTPLQQAQRCYDAAKKYLKRVHVGNLGLLGGRLRP